MVLGFDPRYWLHLFLAYSYTFIFSNFPSPFYRGLSALYSLPSCILAFHLEGFGSFPLILVPSGLHWKISTPGFELWWHCLGVIFSLMRLAKWVQSIECGCDGCFIYILPFFARWQIFLLFLGLCSVVFRISTWSSREYKSILGGTWAL